MAGELGVDEDRNEEGVVDDVKESEEVETDDRLAAHESARRRRSRTDEETASISDATAAAGNGWTGGMAAGGGNRASSASRRSCETLSKPFFRASESGVTCVPLSSGAGMRRSAPTERSCLTKRNELLATACHSEVRPRAFTASRGCWRSRSAWRTSRLMVSGSCDTDCTRMCSGVFLF